MNAQWKYGISSPERTKLYGKILHLWSKSFPKRSQVWLSNSYGFNLYCYLLIIDWFLSILSHLAESDWNHHDDDQYNTLLILIQTGCGKKSNKQKRQVNKMILISLTLSKMTNSSALGKTLTKRNKSSHMW